MGSCRRLRSGRELIESVAKKVIVSGGAYVVFNNAGYGLAGPLEGLTDNEVMRMVNTNMRGADPPLTLPVNSRKLEIC